MFTLKSKMASDALVDLEDAAQTKFALTALGYYDDTETGLAPYPEKQLFSSIKSYQKDKALKVDGYMNPDGETERSIRSSLEEDEKAGTALGDFQRNYNDMKKHPNLDGADKYFHCKAHYEATERGWLSELISTVLGNAKEWKDLPKYGYDDINKDSRANYDGRQAAKSGKYKSARDACAIYRVEGIGDEY